MTLKTAALCLALALAAPLAAHADENADKLTIAKSIVDKTILKTLDTGFSASLEKTVAQMPEDKAEKTRKDARTEFATQRQVLLDGLSKNYAEKFSLDELKRVQAIYDDPIYQKFQAVNADPKSDINLLSQATVTKLLNMLSLIAAGNQPSPITGESQMKKQMQMPPEGK